MGVLPVLGLIFITLKLIGYIAWSWWWVLAPFWAIPFVFIALMMLGVGGVLGISALTSRR